MTDILDKSGNKINSPADDTAQNIDTEEKTDKNTKTSADKGSPDEVPGFDPGEGLLAAITGDMADPEHPEHVGVVFNVNPKLSPESALQILQVFAQQIYALVMEQQKKKTKIEVAPANVLNEIDKLSKKKASGK